MKGRWMNYPLWIPVFLLVLIAFRPHKEFKEDERGLEHFVSLHAPASAIEHPASSMNAKASQAFVASRIGSVYHLPSCSHYVPKIKGPIYYSTKELAEQDGKTPCRECLGDRNSVSNYNE